MKGATTSGGTRIGRPAALSMIAHWVTARTRTLPSSPTNSMWRSNRAPLGASPDPGAAGQRLAIEGGAEVIDLVPHHDPDIIVLVRGVGDAVPMRQRDFLDPLHPDGIVDVAKLVDVLGARR